MQLQLTMTNFKNSIKHFGIVIKSGKLINFNHANIKGEYNV